MATVSPDSVLATTQGSAYAAAGPIDRPFSLCIECIDVEAQYLDQWFTSITRAPLRLTGTDGVFVDGNALTESLGTYGVVDGEAPTAPMERLGTFYFGEVSPGAVKAELVPASDADAAVQAVMDELGAALTTFRDARLSQLRPYVADWEQRGFLSIPEAYRRGVGRGLNAWWQGEADFWGSVSDLAVRQAQNAMEFYGSLSPAERVMASSPIGLMQILGMRGGERLAEEFVELFGDIGDLAEFVDLIMDVVRGLASGTVNVMEAALERLKSLPGEFGEIFQTAIDNGQEWIESLILIASETNAFEYTFRILMAVVMNMTPNFWAELTGLVGGFLLPEVIIELFIMVIVALSGGGAFPVLAARFAAFVAKLRTLGRTVQSANVLVDLMQGFRRIVAALADLGRALHRGLQAVGRGAAGGVARIRQTLNQFEIVIDPNTLGMNGGAVRIFRKRVRPVLLDGDSRSGWQHIQERHMPPNGEADLFAPGTTRDQIEAAAADLVENGTRVSDPTRAVQVYERRMNINGLRTNYRVVVDTSNGHRVVTLFPVLGGP